MEWETTLRPLLSPLDLELYDVEFSSGTLSVVVNRPGGVDLEDLTKANRTISEWLDLNDPIASRFTLDVSSPGLERRLRTVAHFTSAIGEEVTLRERRDGAPTRRLQGPLRGVTDTTLSLDDQEHGLVEVNMVDVERARTVFAWGATAPTPKRSKSSTTSKKG